MLYFFNEHSVEIIIDEGAEVSLEDLNEAYKVIQENLKAPYNLLINKKNSYSYTAEAQFKLASLENLNATAIVVYSNLTKIVIDLLKAVQEKAYWNMKTFTSRDEALNWLELQ